MQIGLSLALTQPRGGGAAVDTSITLIRDVFLWGSSSISGTSGGVTETLPKQLALAIDAAATHGTEAATGGASYAVHTVSGGHEIHNRGKGNDNSAAILVRVQGDDAELGSDDFVVLHRGDNGLTVTDATTVQTLYDDHDDMKASVDVTTRPWVGLTNCNGGWSGAAYPETPGSFYPVVKEVLFRRMSADTPGRLWSMHHTLMDHAVAANADDTTDLHRGNPPRSYMLADGSHMDADGYNCQNDFVLTPLVDAIEGGTPFPLRQFLVAQQPATPAAADPISTIVAYGSGGTFALDASNTQADYAVSSVGAVARIGATPPTRDLTRVRLKTSKPGRADKVQPSIWVGESAASGVSRLVEFDGYCILTGGVSQLANAAKGTLVFRLQGGTGQDGVLVNLVGASSTLQIRRTASNQIDINWRNAAATIILNFTSGSNLFRATDAPRWVMIAWDIPNGIGQCYTWAVPATATSITNSAAATLTGDNTQLARLDQPFAIGHNAVALTPTNLDSGIGKFRMGDFWLARDYIDPAVQANRELFSATDGTPNTTLVASSDGVVSTISPALYIRGNATNWRMCNFLGTQHMAFFSWYNSGTAENGYLVTRPT